MTTTPTTRMKAVLIGAVATMALSIGIATAHAAPTHPSTCAPITNPDNPYKTGKYAPHCVNGVMVADTPVADMPEDAYGWNCWIDGNRYCGARLVMTASGCLTSAGDGYTMCRDGRVYIWVHGRPTGVVLRVPKHSHKH